MDLSQFTDNSSKRNKQQRTSSDIFVYRNLRDFEKVLFLEHQVKELIELLKRKNNHILELNEQLDRVIENNEESAKNKIIKALKAEITNNLRVIKKYKEQLNQLK